MRALDQVLFDGRDPAYGSLVKAVYASQSGTEALVTGDNVRSSMLPPSVGAGVGSIPIPAGAMPVGSYLRLEGTGLIGARLTTPPGFNFVPWVSTDGGVTKTSLPGFAQGPLLGTDGTCSVWLRITQTAAGLRTSGVIQYGAMNGQHYSIQVNPGTYTAGGNPPSTATSVLPTVVPSDPNVARTIGVDGFWGTGADGREYVRCRAIVAALYLPA